MEGIADSMAKMAEEMKRMAITHTETQSMVTALTEKQASMQVQLDTQSVVSSLPGPSQLLAKKEDWTLDTTGLKEDDLVSEKRCQELIQQALTGKVAPVLTAAFGELKHTQNAQQAQMNHLEEMVKTMQIRCAWMEKDMLSSQIEVAKRTILARNWPDWMTEADRQLTIYTASIEVGLVTNSVDITNIYRVGDDNKKKLGDLTVLTVQNFGCRKQLMNGTESRLQPMYWKKVEKTRVDPQTKEEVKFTVEEATEYGTKATIKLAPGITQMERRLGAPLHGLMNAYCHHFKRFKRQSLVPRWKTLVLEDENGVWLGRLKYTPVSYTHLTLPTKRIV